MKKTLSIALVILVIILMLTGCTKSGNKKDGDVSLKESPLSDFEYETKNDAAVINKYIGDEKTVVIPNSIDGCEVVSINVVAFAQNKTIEKVVFPDSVKYIWNRAFADCSNLKEVVFCEELEFIGIEAFENCTSLKEIDLPQDLKQIESRAFRNCSSVTKITIPKCSTYTLGTFANCTSLKEVVFEEGTQIINSVAFNNATSLETLTIPASVKQIISNTFFDSYTNLKSIKFLGDAPNTQINSAKEIKKDLVIYYKEGAKGWDTSPLAEKFTLIAE